MQLHAYKFKAVWPVNGWDSDPMVLVSEYPCYSDDSAVELGRVIAQGLERSYVEVWKHIGRDEVLVTEVGAIIR